MFTRRDASNTTGSQTTEPQRVTPPIESTPAPQPAAAQTLATPTTSAPPAASVATAATSGNESLVASDDTFEGQLRTARGVRVMGTVRGGIESDQYVHIEENAHVEADISAEEVVIAGTYEGKLTCRQRVEIRATGRVSGQIDTAKLLLHEGGYFDGELHMQKPATAPATAATTTPAKSENEDRPRRTRYVDLSSDTSTTREVGSNDAASSS